MENLTLQQFMVCAALAVLTAIVSALYLPFSITVLTLALTFIMAAITISDLRHFIIPDQLSLPAIPLGILAFWIVSGMDGAYSVTMSVLGALLGGISLYAIKVGYARFKGFEGLGMGDVKLFAAGGAWLGPENLAITLLLASLGALAAVVISVSFAGQRNVTRMTALPFGAFIAPAIWLIWIFQQTSQYQPMALLGL